MEDDRYEYENYSYEEEQTRENPLDAAARIVGSRRSLRDAWDHFGEGLSRGQLSSLAKGLAVVAFGFFIYNLINFIVHL